MEVIMSETTGYYFQLFVPLIVLFFVLWFFIMRPQKKKDNEVKKMRNSLQEGDEVVTIGGIIGRVLTVKEDSVVLYVGSDKTKVEFKRWAVGEVTKKSDKAAKAEPVAGEEQEPAKRKIKKLARKEDEEEKNPLAE
jgi:preprotein translocase subunit YajC